MGRKSLEKNRLDNPVKKLDWAKQLNHIFHEKGLRSFTMDDIALILKKSKATVYKYFKTREEIVELSIDYKLAEIKSFEDVLHDERIEYVERYMKAIEILSLNIHDMSTIYLKDLKRFYPAQWQRVVDFQEYSIKVLKAYYKKGIEKGHFRNINTAILSLGDKLFFNALLDPKFLEQNNLTPTQAFEEYFKMKCHGMLK